MTSEQMQIGLSTREEVTTTTSSISSLQSIRHRAPAKVDTTLLISTTARGEPKTTETDVIDDSIRKPPQQLSTQVKVQVHAHMVVEGGAAAGARVPIKMLNLHAQ